MQACAKMNWGLWPITCRATPRCASSCEVGRRAATTRNWDGSCYWKSSSRKSARRVRAATLREVYRSKGPGVYTGSSFVLYVLPANIRKKIVYPTSLELVISAMRGRSEGFAVVHQRSKNRLTKPNLHISPSRMFALVRSGCRQTVVSCGWDLGLTIPVVKPSSVTPA